MRYTTRNNCRREPVKYIPIITEVQVNDIPENFPKSLQKMIGNTYPAIQHTDSRGETWYKILKDLVFGKSEAFNFSFAYSVQKNSDKVSFENRKYIKLQARYCN